MVKFLATRNGKRLIGFGLSRENCERLLKDQPIVVALDDDMGIPLKADILIFAGETEAAMADMLFEQGVVSSGTIIHIDPKLKS